MPEANIDYDEVMRVAVASAKAAGAVIKEAFFKVKNVEHKGQVDLVTETDKACEDLVCGAIKDAFPSHMFIGEEESSASGTPELTDDPTWFCDPLDGTTNFVHGFPFVCVCVGFAIKKEVVLGVVFAPVLDELFCAIKGRGATLNGNPIHVSSTEDMGSALMATEIGVSRESSTMDAIYGRIRALTPQIRGVRCGGSCGMNMCGVAMGRLDAFFEIGFGGPWDCAAPAIILQEAGGVVLDPSGGAFNVMGRRVLAANGKLGQKFANVLKECPDAPDEPKPTPPGARAKI